MWGLLLIESTYFIACLAVNTDAVRGRTNALRGGSRPAARPRSLEGTLRCNYIVLPSKVVWFFYRKQNGN